eukprot:jgi/Tetstr1/439878/TSEL_028286.t1
MRRGGGRARFVRAVALLLLGTIGAGSAGDEPNSTVVGPSGRHLLQFFGSKSSIFTSSAVSALLSGGDATRAAASAPAPATGGRPAGPYSPDEWTAKTSLVTKHQPASHCGDSSPLAFRSRVPVPIMRKCAKQYRDVPRYAVLLVRPEDSVRAKVASMKAWLNAEYLAMWDKTSHTVHTDDAVNSPWQKALNGPNDALIFARGDLGVPDIADRLLRTTAGRLAVLVTEPDRQLPMLSEGWLENAAALFHEHPKLGVIGMASGKPAGFSFTLDGGSGPWVVRRDAMIEAGAVGLLDFCVHSCPIGQGLAAIAWMGGFQVAQMTQDAVAWPVPHVPLPQGTLASCVQVGKLAVNMGAISTAVSAARKAATSGAATAAGVALQRPCKPLLLIRNPVQAVPAACGKGPGASIVASIAIQYFRRPKAIKGIVKALNALKEPIEILVNDDSRTQHTEWLASLGENGVLFHHPNIHEIRGYNRLARFARGDMFIMMQDDDQPTNGVWVTTAKQLFNAHKLLGMIGGLRGRMDTGKSRDKDTNQNAGQKFGPRFSRIKGMDPAVKVPFMFMYKAHAPLLLFAILTQLAARFAAQVNAAPLVARRDAMMQLGGLQEGFSCPGDAGIGFDFEYSIHLWKAGYQVGLYNVNFKRPQPGSRGKAGTRSDGKKWSIRRQNERTNNGLLYKMYPGFHHVQGTRLALAANHQQGLQG